MQNRHRAILALLLIAAVSCASTGTGDPAVVRAEDLLTNSLTVYHQVMIFHYGNPLAVPPIPGHSTMESPAVYHTIERFRVEFPIIWNSVDKAKRDYQANKSLGTSNLDAAVAALTQLLNTVTPIIAGGA